MGGSGKRTRYCDYCGAYYRGYGAKYCSKACFDAKQRGEPAPKDTPNGIPAPEEIPNRDDLGLTTIFRPINIHVTPKTYTETKRSDTFQSVHYGDIHFPFQDERALTIRNKVLDFLSPDLVVDHGDTGDCVAISRFPKDPHDRVTLADEFEMMAQDFGEVHALTPDAEHVWLEGNHEKRLEKLVWNAADERTLGEIFTLQTIRDALSWGKLLGLDSLGWEIVPYPSFKLLWDKLLLVHGNTARVHSAYSARSEHDRYGKSGISGHTHRMGSYYHTDYNGTHAWHELGLLGKIRTDYVAHANWQQGMGVVTWSDDREHWAFEPISINDGVAYFRGLRFDA